MTPPASGGLAPAGGLKGFTGSIAHGGGGGGGNAQAIAANLTWTGAYSGSGKPAV